MHIFFTTEWIFKPARIVLNHAWYQYSPCILRFIKKLNQLIQCKVCNYGRNTWTTWEKLYQETDFRPLKRWYRKLGCLLKIKKKKSLSNIFELVSSLNLRYLTWNSDTMHVFFKMRFFHLNYKRVEETLTRKFESWKALAISKT